MKGQPFLGLTAQIHDALGVELQFKDMLIVALHLCLLKCLEQSIEQKEVLIFRVVGHDDEERYNAVEHIEYLLI